MNRYVGVMLLAMLIGAAAFVYDVKFESQHLSRKLDGLQRQIERERDMISTLKAEWSYLNQPARLQELVSRHLKNMKTLEVSQMSLPHELPERPLDLGMFIDQLGPGADVSVPIPVPVAKPFRMAPSLPR